MIISDKHKFVFIHIPKCAGTTVRKKIEPLDDTNGFFTKKCDNHKQLGIIDYVHIPLFILSRFFENEFDKIKNYTTFTVVRNPFDRFPSSIATHLSMYGQKPIRNLDKNDLKNEVDRIIDFLSKRKGNQEYLPHEYIHFQRQKDFIYINENKIIDKIYSVSSMDKLFREINEVVGVNLFEYSLERNNISKVYRNRIVKILMEDVRPNLESLYKPILPDFLKKKLLNTFLVKRDAKFNALFQAEYISDFVKDYYAEDIKLFEEMQNQKSQ